MLSEYTHDAYLIQLTVNKPFMSTNVGSRKCNGHELIAIFNYQYPPATASFQLQLTIKYISFTFGFLLTVRYTSQFDTADTDDNLPKVRSTF